MIDDKALSADAQGISKPLAEGKAPRRSLSEEVEEFETIARSAVTPGQRMLVLAAATHFASLRKEARAYRAKRKHIAAGKRQSEALNALRLALECGGLLPSRDDAPTSQSSAPYTGPMDGPEWQAELRRRRRALGISD